MDSCVQYSVFCLYKYFKKKVLSLIKNGRGNYEVSLSLQNIQTFNLTETVEPNGQTNSLQDTQVIGGT